MPDRFLSPALVGCHEDIQSLLVPLAGIEANIYNDIWNAILDRKLKPGMKIEELPLGEIYGISRTVIRKVLVIMEQEGIIHLPLNRGAYIAKPTPQDAEDLLEAMQTLVTYFVRKLADASDDRRAEAHKRLAVHLAAEKEAWQSGDFHTRRRLRLEFGAVLGLLAGNRIQTANYVRSAIQLSLALALYQTQALSQQGVESDDLVTQAIFDGKPDEAVAQIDATFKYTRHTLDFDPSGEVADLNAIFGKGLA